MIIKKEHPTLLNLPARIGSAESYCFASSWKLPELFINSPVINGFGKLGLKLLIVTSSTRPAHLIQVRNRIRDSTDCMWRF